MHHATRKLDRHAKPNARRVHLSLQKRDLMHFVHSSPSPMRPDTPNVQSPLLKQDLMHPVCPFSVHSCPHSDAPSVHSPLSSRGQPRSRDHCLVIELVSAEVRFSRETCHAHEASDCCHLSLNVASDRTSIFRGVLRGQHRNLT